MCREKTPERQQARADDRGKQRPWLRTLVRAEAERKDGGRLVAMHLNLNFT